MWASMTAQAGETKKIYFARIAGDWLSMTTIVHALDLLLPFSVKEINIFRKRIWLMSTDGHFLRNYVVSHVLQKVQDAGILL